MSAEDIVANVIRANVAKPDDKYVVYGPSGEVVTFLNSHLAVRQKVSDAQLEALKLSHQLRYSLFEAAKTISTKQVLSEADILKLRLLAKQFDELENQQQALWNFDVNPNFHRFWDFPGCSCPRLDNEDRYGTKFAVHSDSCPIHGK